MSETYVDIVDPWGNSSGNRNGYRSEEKKSHSDFMSKFADFVQKRSNNNNSSKNKLSVLIIIILFLLPILLPKIGAWIPIQEGAEGVVFRFGRFNRTVGPGFQIKFPEPIEKITVIETERIHVSEISTSPSRLSNLVDEARSRNNEIDYVASLVTGSNNPLKNKKRYTGNQNLILTGDENVVNLEFTVQWRVRDPVKYLLGSRDPSFLVRITSESVMRAVIGSKDLEYIITKGRQDIEGTVFQGTQSTLDLYETGIQILQVQLQKADPPDQVIESFRDVVNASQDAEQMLNKANEYYNDVVPNARGNARKIIEEAEAYKHGRVNRALGEVERFKKVYSIYKNAPDVVRKRIFLETIEGMLRDSNRKYVIGSGLSNSFLQHMSLDPLPNVNNMDDTVDDDRVKSNDSNSDRKNSRKRSFS